MASAREERMQARLRGAQPRQVKDVSFGLVFSTAPAPVESAAERQATPQPPLPSQSSSKATPASRGRGRPRNASTKVTARRSTDANISVKRRKLDAVSSTPLSSSSQSQRAPSRDIYDIPPDDAPDIHATENVDNSMDRIEEIQMLVAKQATTPSMLLSSAPAAVINAVEQASLDAELHDRTATRDLETSEIASEANERETRATRRKRKRGEDISPTRPSESQQHEQERQTQVDDIDELSSEQPKRRGRRPKVSVTKAIPDVEQYVEEDSQELAEAIGDNEAASVLKRNRGKTVNTPRAQATMDRDAEKARPAWANRRTAKTRTISPAQQRQPRKPSILKTRGTVPSGKTKRVKIPHGSPIKVPVFRLTEGPTYDEDESDAEILNNPISHANKGGVNAIDVLSQICNEVIEVGLGHLRDRTADSETSAERKEYKVKLRAVETFHRELQTRLLDHTINLDNTYTLEKRLREAKRRKISLREDIIRVRAEREKIAIRMDEVRIKHEVEKEIAEKRNALNYIVHDIEVAVDRGKDIQADGAARSSTVSGTEVLMRRLADQVSAKSVSGGTLKQIRDFNTFLERAALALEDTRSA